MGKFSPLLRPAPEATPLAAYTRPRAGHFSDWKQQARDLQTEVFVAWSIFKDRRTPWYVRAVAALVVGYLFSPVQLIPSFIPVIGFLDDFLVLGAGMRLIRWLTAEHVLRDARDNAHSAVQQGNQNIKPPMLRTAVIAIASASLLVTVFFWSR